jgi:hypothetical protein
MNIGVLTGKPSGGLIDVDIDHRLALELSDQFLPLTPAVFGRASNRRSHRLYKVNGPVKTRRFKSTKHGTIVEIRSTGAQTIFPGSTHPSGEIIEWEDPDAEPAEIDAETLIRAVEALANAVKVRLQEKPRRKRSHDVPPPVPMPVETSDERMAACLERMMAMEIDDANDGSHRLFAAACRAVEFDLDDQQAVACIRAYEQRRPFPNPWPDLDIIKRIRNAEQRCERGHALVKARKMQIVIGTDEHRVIDQATRALGDDPDLYQRGGQLVRVIQVAAGSADAPDGKRLTIALIPPANLRDRLTRHVAFFGLDKNDELVPKHPPEWAFAGIAARGAWPCIRVIEGIVDAPILRADGTILQTPGYDQRSGVVYAPSQEFPVIDEEVDIDDAHASLEFLMEMVCDFPFESDEHRAAWLAALLTGLAHHAFDGPSPLFLIDANIRGAGKGLLAQTIGRTVLGTELPVFSYAHDAEEMRKKLTSIAIAGDRMNLLDNLEGEFGNDALDRALTATRWKDRVLGGNGMIDLPLRVTWLATGNNVVVKPDTVRRVIHIRLDVFHENPENRSGFKHPNLLAWIKDNRARLLVSALTILRAYCRAGRLQQDLEPLGSFEGWSNLVRQAVVWMGLPDPCLTRVKLAATGDTGVDGLRRLLAAWFEFDRNGDGYTLASLRDLLYPEQPELHIDRAGLALRAAIEDLCECNAGRPPEVRTLAARLRAHRHRVVDGLYLEVDDSQRRNGLRWLVRRVQNDPRA